MYLWEGKIPSEVNHFEAVVIGVFVLAKQSNNLRSRQKAWCFHRAIGSTPQTPHVDSTPAGG